MTMKKTAEIFTTPLPIPAASTTGLAQLKKKKIECPDAKRHMSPSPHKIIQSHTKVKKKITKS